MRTSLNEIKQIENWLLERGEIPHRLLTEAKVLTNPEIREKAHWQSTSYEIVRLYGREKLREEIRSAEDKLFHTPKYKSFQNRIRSIFKL